MTHQLKTLPEYFEDVLAGRKSFEVRKDDRNPKYAPGDKLILQEYKPTGDTGVYTGRAIHADVLLVLRGKYCRDGYCIMSILPTHAVNAEFATVTEIGRLHAEINSLENLLNAAIETIRKESGCWECEVRDTTGCEEAFYRDDCPNWKWRGDKRKKGRCLNELEE